MAESKLRACPFCGSTDLVLETVNGLDNTPIYLKIKHFGDSACGINLISDSEEALVKQWNNRPKSQKQWKNVFAAYFKHDKQGYNAVVRRVDQYLKDHPKSDDLTIDELIEIAPLRKLSKQKGIGRGVYYFYIQDIYTLSQAGF